ncbi:MAG: hypothetical protein LBI88_05520, partial [Deltaproteobacteria bacterium]|nr:hypothetical protein [Deltaproteobacteria bacterium]
IEALRRQHLCQFTRQKNEQLRSFIHPCKAGAYDQAAVLGQSPVTRDDLLILVLRGHCAYWRGQSQGTEHNQKNTQYIAQIRPVVYAKNLPRQGRRI